MLKVIKRIIGVPVQIGGEQHTGWLPVGAATPLPTPVRNVIFDIEIQHDGHGFLLCYSARDGSAYGDTWHESIAEAEQAAFDYFGTQPSQWVSG